MLTFTVVALRLIGLWLVVSWAASLVLNIGGMIGLINFQTEPPYMLVTTVAAAIPIVCGIAMIAFAHRIARLFVPMSATSTPTPEISERGFSQIGALLIGISAVIDSVPPIAAYGFSDSGMPPRTEDLVLLAIGLLLILGSGLFAGFVVWLRKLSSAGSHGAP